MKTVVIVLVLVCDAGQMIRLNKCCLRVNTCASVVYFMRCCVPFVIKLMTDAISYLLLAAR